MDRATKNKILIRYVSTLEDKHGSVGAAEENGDELYKEMREFIKQFFNDRDSESSLIWSNGSHWNEEEVEAYLKKHYATKDTKDISEELGMSPELVRSKAWHLGLRKQKNDKAYIESFIIKNHKTMSRSDMSKATGLSYSGISRYLRRLKDEGKIDNLVSLKGSRKTKWTEEEMDYLAKHYSFSSIGEIAKALDRTDSSVRSKACNMGLRKYS